MKYAATDIYSSKNYWHVTYSQIIHWNSPRKLKVKTRHVEFFRTLHLTFQEYDDITWNRHYYLNVTYSQIIHWNSPRKLKVKTRHVEFFRTLHLTFQEYDANLLKNRIFGCSTAANSPLDDEVCLFFHPYKPL